MLMHEIIRDGRSPGALAACRGESSSLLKVLRRERRALAAIEDARYSYGTSRCAGDSIEDYQRQVSRLSACITNLEGMGMGNSVAGRDWVARAALRASSMPSERVDATTAAAIRAVKDAAASTAPPVAYSRAMAPCTAALSEAANKAVEDSARHKAQPMGAVLRGEATAKVMAAAAAAAAAMVEAGWRGGQAGRAGGAEGRPLEGASMAEGQAEEASMVHTSREASTVTVRLAAATEDAALRQASPTLHTPATPTPGTHCT